MSDDFHEVIGPLFEPIEQQVAAIDRARDSWKAVPAAHSVAMGELAAQKRYRGDSPWGRHPAEETHGVAHLLGLSIGDHVRAVSRLLGPPEPSMYAHTTTARAALEACGQLMWLLEPADVASRIARGANLRIKHLREQARWAPDSDARSLAGERAAGLLAAGTAVGVPVDGRFFVPHPLGFRRLAALAIDPDAGDDSFSGVLYGHVSGVAHPTMGLLDRIQPDEEVPLADGLLAGHPRLTGDEVANTVAFLFLAVRRAGRRYLQHFGWHTADWDEIDQRGREVIGGTIRQQVGEGN